MDTSNHPQAVVHNTKIIDWAFGSRKYCTEFLHKDSFVESALVPTYARSFLSLSFFKKIVVNSFAWILSLLLLFIHAFRFEPL